MKRWWPWLIALLPAVLGFAAAFLLQGTSLPNMLLSIQVDLGTFLLLVGLALSGIGLGIVGVRAIDQRKLKRTLVVEQRLAAAAHRRFVRRLDHELKNPLTAMRMGLDNLAGTSSETEKTEALHMIGAHVERIGQLTTDLRKLVELEVMPLEWSSVDIGKLLESAMEQARQQPEAAQRQLLLSVPQAPWPLPRVRGDPDLLYLAIYNLLDNALKFTEPHDRIEVRASDSGDTIVIEVADTGLGLPDDELSHVFDELYRGQEARGIPGSGLGLALVKAVMKRHGGAVSVRSLSEQGSVFQLHLPTLSGES